MRKSRWLFKHLLQHISEFVRNNTLHPLPALPGTAPYSLAKGKSDAMAGLNVALLAFPQGMAYAVIANLPLTYGIVSGTISALVAPFFSGSRFTILGPTNATAFMLFASMAPLQESERLFYLPLVVLFIGVLLVLGSLFRVAELVQYVSRSVVVGYITAAAILIVANQISHLLGIRLDALQNSGESQTFFTIVQMTASELDQTHWQAAVLGVATLLLWFPLSRRFKKFPTFPAVLIVMTGVYHLLHHTLGWKVDTFNAFSLHDLVPQLPKVSHHGFFSDVSRLIGIALSVAFLAALENSVMSKSLASKAGDRPDVNQDMYGVGVTNIACAFTGGMPASGSLTRSTLNYLSGAQTRIATIFSGLFGLAGLLLLGSYISLIPKTCMAALVIGIALSVINRRHLRISLNATPQDAAVLLTTIIASLLLPLNVAIFLGVGISIALYLRAASRPSLLEYEFSEEGELRQAGEKRTRPNPSISIVHVEGDLFFGAAEIFRTQIQKISLDPDLQVIILRLKNARHLDATSVVALEEMVQFIRSHGRHVIISGAPKDVYRVLRNAGTIDVIGRENIFPTNTRNPNLSTRHALMRAQDLIGGKANVKIYYDPSKK